MVDGRVGGGYGGRGAFLFPLLGSAKRSCTNIRWPAWATDFDARFFGGAAAGASCFTSFDAAESCAVADVSPGSTSAPLLDTGSGVGARRPRLEQSGGSEGQ